MASLRERMGLGPVSRPTDKRAEEIFQRKQADFLEMLSETGLIQESSIKSGLSRAAIKWLRKNDAEFEELYNECLELGNEAIEDEAVYRATKGTLEPVFFKGKRTGSIRKKSDLLLIFILKGRFPERYRDNAPPPQPDSDYDALESPRERLASRIDGIKERLPRASKVIDHEGS